MQPALELLAAVRPHLQVIYIIALFFAALRWGAPPEQLLGTVLFAAMSMDRAYHLLAHGQLFWHHLNVGHMVLDFALLAIFVWVALWANRIYPLWIAAAQIIAVLAHAYRAGIAVMDLMAYDLMTIVPSYLQILFLTIGLYSHMSRRKTRGNYPSWRS